MHELEAINKQFHLVIERHDIPLINYLVKLEIQVVVTEFSETNDNENTEQ